METLTNCPVCRKNKQEPFLICTDHTVSRETFAVVRCAACGFRFTNPRPAPSEIGKYYESEEYISHSGTSRGVVNKIYGLVRNYTIARKVNLINALTGNLSERTPSEKPEIRSLLDIGCGTGEFLNASKQNGWKVTGIEPSDVARSHAKENFGIEPLSPEKLFDLNEKQFSAITLWHVLEHVHELDKTIEQISKLLLKEGVLIIAVPNCNSFDAEKYGAQWAAWDVPRHIYHFTKPDIEKLFSRFGFKLTEALPMKFDSFYVSLLSEKYKNGSANLVKGFLSGLQSNLAAVKNNRGYSSQIYILKSI
jgi:2-polyprenyl-3-methyl-5-hydroxy-6-metoxy-1,4-benzoquinol methylase